MPLGPWAIAKRSLRIQIVLSSSPQHHFLDGVMDKVPTSKTGGPGFKSQLRQWNSFKKSKFPFFNEDTLAIEVCIKLKSQIDAWKSTFPLSREWKSTFPLSREWKSCNPCMYTMLR